MMLAHATCRLHIDVHGSKSIHTELFVLMIQGGAMQNHEEPNFKKESMTWNHQSTWQAI